MESKGYMEEVRDLLIIGGGPAGVSAGVYAARKKLNTLFVADSFGGQSVESMGVENWIGTKLISGIDFGKMLKDHLKQYEADDFIIKETEVISIKKIDNLFKVELKNKDTSMVKAIIFATGSKRRKLDVLGADKFEHKGLTYCASCDGPIFTGKDVVVVGGGNAGFETAAQLLKYTKTVTLIHRGEKFKADKITVDKVIANPKMTAILSANTKEVFGESLVKGIKYEEKGEIKTLNAEGIFVEIGLIPSTELADGLVELDEYKRIKVDPYTQKTSDEFIWAAGDCTDVKFHQNNIAAGDAVKAIEDCFLKLHNA